MSDQGDAGRQQRPASSRPGPYSEPDEMTGPLPAVDDGTESAAPGFPPADAGPDPRSADDDAPADGSPGSPTPTGHASWRSASRERAPFEPADPPAARKADGPDDGPAKGAESSDEAETPPAPRVDPYDAVDADHGYEVSGAGLGPESWNSSSAPRTSSGHAHADHRRQDAPPPRPVRFPDESFGEHAAVEEGPANRFRQAEEHDADSEFFDAGDHPQMWDTAVAPTGPPPQPGKPSSGNLRMPDWMREENGGPAASDGPGFEKEGRSKLPILVGVLVVGLAVAGGVYYVKGRGQSPTPVHAAKPHRSATRQTRPARAPKTAQPAAPQPERALARFPGAHTKPAGVVADRRSGLSYPRLAKPWQVSTDRKAMTDLGVSSSQFVVTEKTGGKLTRWGRLMSAPLGAAEKGAYSGPGTAHTAVTRVADSYEARLYGFRHHKKVIASQPLNVDGHRGWLVGYYLTYHRPGTKATGDLFTVALVDTGKKIPGIILMSVPNTHRTLWPDVNYVVHGLKVG